MPTCARRSQYSNCVCLDVVTQRELEGLVSSASQYVRIDCGLVRVRAGEFGHDRLCE